jgi:mono/diheme cytochrome c family protein
LDSQDSFEPNVDQQAEWNRGAYLVEALGPCGDCHTPRVSNAPIAVKLALEQTIPFYGSRTRVHRPGKNANLKHTLLIIGRDGYAVALAIGE